MLIQKLCGEILSMLVIYSFLEISSAARTKRQIVFEDNNENKLFTSECRTPDRKSGSCIRLTTCTHVWDTVSLNKLHPYVCGFEGEEPKVCCPRSGLQVPSHRPTQRTNICGKSLFPQTRVMGGTEAEKGSWPWMAVILKANSRTLTPRCGGALISSKHVVTAAHCVFNAQRNIPIDPSTIIVRLGAHDLTVLNEPGAVDVGVKDVRCHDQFDFPTLKNDIAVLKLRRSVRFTDTIAPVCLPYESLKDEDLGSRAAYVIGFGTIALDGKSSNVLMQAGFYIQSQEICERAYENDVQISKSHICAGMMDGSRDACQGDSGSPLLTAGSNSSSYLVGVVSFGKQCGTPNYPGVYTRVTEYLDWLSRNSND